MPKDLRTKAIVLRRTKYGETDRILSFLTPEGKQDVIAKGVRKERSKLAGGIELFSVSEITIHQGRDEHLGILTSAKMLKFYNNILGDLSRLELASAALKQVNRLASDVKDPQLFQLLEQVFAGLHQNLNLTLVEIWYLLNFAKLSGEEINLHFDVTGAKLVPDQTYLWDHLEGALSPHSSGKISVNHIKFLRLLVSASLATAAQVQGAEDLLPDLLPIARAFKP